MLVMDVVGVVIVVVVPVIVRMAVVVAMMMRGAGDRRYRRSLLQRAREPAALGPDQPGAERRDQRIARDLDGPFSTAHGFGSGVEQPGTNPHDQDGNQRLHQRRGERQHDAAPRGLLVGDQIGRDHRLAMAGTGGVEDAVGERDRQQRPDRRAVRLGGADGRGHLAVEFRLLGENPADDAAGPRFGGTLRGAERRLRQHHMHQPVEQHHPGHRRGAHHQAAREPRAGFRDHGHCTVILLANIAP